MANIGGESGKDPEKMQEHSAHANSAHGTSAHANGAANGVPASEGFAADTLNLLSEHKGKLAFGAAAALGLMILYNWREKSLAEEDPEDYARLRKFTAPFKPEDEEEQEEFERRMREEYRPGKDD